MSSAERAEAPVEMVLVRVSATLRDRVQAVAMREGRTIGKQFERLVEEPLMKAEKEAGIEARA